MFNSQITIKDSANSGLSSGYNPARLPQQAAEIKNKFRATQHIDFENATEEKLLKLGQLEGDTRSAVILAKELSKQQLKVGKNLQTLQGVMWNHVNGAAKNELAWRKTEAKGKQSLSATMLQLGIEDNAHAGFASRLDIADRLIQY